MCSSDLEGGENDGLEGESEKGEGSFDDQEENPENFEKTDPLPEAVPY